MPTFLIDIAQVTEKQLTIDGERAHHIQRALRHQRGDIIRVTDGQGQWWRAEIEALAKHHIHCAIIEHGHETQRPSDITIAVAVVAKDRWRLVLEKATELGAAAIQPMITANTQRHHVKGDKHEHWQRIIEAAAQQCDRCVMPSLKPAQPFFDLCSDDMHQDRWICVEPQPDALHIPQKMLAPSPRSVIYIGPEGGWTAEELKYASAHDCAALNLGPHVLRTETAVCAALTRVQALWWT